MSSPGASGGDGSTKDPSPNVTQVLRNSELFTNILRFVDTASWENVFLVEKAWLPIATKYRCRKASFKVIKWERDSFWHNCVLDSVREIRSARFFQADAGLTLSPDTLRHICPLFDRFPILDSVELRASLRTHRTPMTRASWAFDRSTGKGRLSVLHQKRKTDDHDCAIVKDFYAPYGRRWTSCDDCCYEFHAVKEHIDDLQSQGWIVDETIRLLVNEGVLHPFRRFAHPAVVGFTLNSIPTDLKNLAQLCSVHNQSSALRSITSITANRVAPYTLADLEAFGKSAGEQLRHLHVYYDPFDNDLGDMRIWHAGIFNSMIECEQLGPMLDSIITHFPSLRTMTIPLHSANIDDDTDMPLPTCSMCPNDRIMRALNIKIRGETWDEHEQALTDAVLPLLAIARNLAFIADGQTEIIFQHYREDDFSREMRFGVFDDLQSQAAVISDIIGFIRSLPELQLSHILRADLELLGIGPNDHQEFVQLTFGADGRPIPRPVQRAMDRYANIKTAWSEVGGKLSIGAVAEASRQLKLMEEASDIDQSRVSPRLRRQKHGDPWESADQAINEVIVELQDVKAENADLKRELVQQKVKSEALAEEAKKLQVAEAEIEDLKRELLALKTKQ